MVHNETLDSAVENFEKLNNVTQSALRLMGIKPDMVVVNPDGKIVMLALCTMEESMLSTSDWGKVSAGLIRKLGETMLKDFNAQLGANPMSDRWDQALWITGWMRA